MIVGGIPMLLGSRSDSHRYWRLAYRLKTGADYASAREIEMRASLGGADQCNGGAAVGSTTDTGVASNSFDNDTVTYWLSAVGLAGQWLEYQFLGPVVVAEITFKPYHFGTVMYGPASFGVEYSDDRVTWTSIKEFTGLTWVADETKTFALS